MLIENGIFRTEIVRDALSPWAKTADSTWSLSASSLGELLLFNILFGAHGGAPELRAKGLAKRQVCGVVGVCLPFQHLDIVGLSCGHSLNMEVSV